MKDKKPLLSICIPTYNRADALEKSIMSIVSQPEFNSDDVELIISDNVSDDATEEVVKKYLAQYKNIYYFRNDQNIFDKNHPMAIKKAHGVFRKLCNDTLIFKDGSIKRLVSIIIENSAKKPVLFWGNDQLGKNHRKAYIIDNFDSFVKIISFMSTWIGGFGIWEEDFDVIDDIFKGCDLHLWHTKILFEIINRKKNAYVNNEVFFYTQDVTKKNLSYGIYRIFYENYLGLYQQYLDNHSLKDSTFNYLKKHELFFFFLPWIVNISCDKDRYITEPDDNLKDMVSNTYRSEKYYILFCVKLYLSMLKRRVRNRIKAGY